MKKCFVMVLLCCLLVAGTAFAKTGTLLVAFGTSMDSARPAIDDIEKAYKKAAGNEPVLLAFTSDIIRNKLAKEGKPVLSVNAAMNELAAQGVTDLKIQSLHIAPAEEYNQPRTHGRQKHHQESRRIQDGQGRLSSPRL